MPYPFVDFIDMFNLVILYESDLLPYCSNFNFHGLKLEEGKTKYYGGCFLVCVCVCVFINVLSVPL